MAAPKPLQRNCYRTGVVQWVATDWMRFNVGVTDGSRGQLEKASVLWGRELPSNFTIPLYDETVERGTIRENAPIDRIYIAS